METYGNCTHTHGATRPVIEYLGSLIRDNAFINNKAPVENFRQNIEILGHSRYIIKLNDTFGPLAHDTDTIMITFHDINDTEFQQNLEVDCRIGIQFTGIQIISDSDNDGSLGPVKGDKLKNNLNQYLYKLTISECRVGYGAHIPMICIGNTWVCLNGSFVVDIHLDDPLTAGSADRYMVKINFVKGLESGNPRIQNPIS